MLDVRFILNASVAFVTSQKQGSVAELESILQFSHNRKTIESVYTTEPEMEPVRIRF